MRMISVPLALVLMSSATLAQQTTGTAPANDAPGYTGAYAPPGATPTPYSTGALPEVDTGPGLDKPGPDGSTRTVKAVPCSTSAHETDGSTTCVGIPYARRTRR